MWISFVDFVCAVEAMIFLDIENPFEWWEIIAKFGIDKIETKREAATYR